MPRPFPKPTKPPKPPEAETPGSAPTVPGSRARQPGQLPYGLSKRTNGLPPGLANRTGGLPPGLGGTKPTPGGPSSIVDAVRKARKNKPPKPVI